MTVCQRTREITRQGSKRHDKRAHNGNHAATTSSLLFLCDIDDDGGVDRREVRRGCDCLGSLLCDVDRVTTTRSFGSSVHYWLRRDSNMSRPSLIPGRRSRASGNGLGAYGGH